MESVFISGWLVGNRAVVKPEAPGLCQIHHGIMYYPRTVRPSCYRRGEAYLMPDQVRSIASSQVTLYQSICQESVTRVGKFSKAEGETH